MVSSRFLRYLAPNLITLSSMIFGLVSLWSSYNGNYPLAAWMIVYAVLTDRLDGLVARAVKGTSELGMQLDSFADFLNFGIAPAFLVLTYLSGRPDLPYHDRGAAHTLLFVVCGGYMLCAVFRLARYNILSDDQVPTKIFFGFPTTLSGGMVAGWILVFLKYDPHTSPGFGGAKLFGDAFQTPPANRGTVQAGSPTVHINSKPAARNGDTVMTCNDPADAPVGKIVAVGTVLVG